MKKYIGTKQIETEPIIIGSVYAESLPPASYLGFIATINYSKL